MLKINSFTILSLALSVLACNTKAPTNLAVNNVIPAMVSVVASGGSFELSEATVIYIQEGQPELQKSASYLAQKLRPATGYSLAIETVSENPKTGIYLNLNSQNITIGNEGYEMDITSSLVTLSAREGAGVFMGIQTLRQLLPNAIESTTVQQVPWEIATGKIIDYPEYGYRGFMLDVSRHFFTIDQVKRCIDLNVGLKLNVMHLHLTDDQGWRIEIKSWPNLTAHGSKTEVGGGEGGFYTQEQYKDIVQYAADRYVMIIPEIDVPSHTNAALSAYPELNCDGKTYDLYTGTEVGFCTLCTDREVVYQFVSDVVRELADITPGPYLHLGGDESHVTAMEDYIPFFNRVQQIVLDNDKTMIGWDEIAHAKLDSSTIVQYWAKAENTIMGVNQGAQVIMSPAKLAYLDMQYDSTSRIGYHWAAYIEVDTAYNWDPAALDKDIPRAAIKGIEAPLWSETVDSMDDIEYLMFPRIMGYAEIGWSPLANRNWDAYKIRLGNHAGRLKLLEVDYYPSSKVPWSE